MKHIKSYLLYAALFISMVTNFILVIKVNHLKDDILLAEEIAFAQDYVHEPDTLSDWEVFTLAPACSLAKNAG